MFLLTDTFSIVGPLPSPNQEQSFVVSVMHWSKKQYGHLDFLSASVNWFLVPCVSCEVDDLLVCQISIFLVFLFLVCAMLEIVTNFIVI